MPTIKKTKVPGKKKYRFFFHYNKPLSKQKGVQLWSVHYRGVCHFVENITCIPATESKVNKRQPVVVMMGYSSEVQIKHKTAIICP